MKTKNSLPELLQKRTKLLGKIRKIGPLMDGSVVTIAKRCGNPNCKCARGEKHAGLFVTYKPPRMKPGIPSKTKTIYVPIALHKDVKQWTDECAKLRFLIREISAVQKEIIRAYVTAKGASRGSNKS
jgi:hypothetical protein